MRKNVFLQIEETAFVVSDMHGLDPVSRLCEMHGQV